MACNVTRLDVDAVSTACIVSDMTTDTTPTTEKRIETDAEFEARENAMIALATRLIASGYSYRSAYRVARESYPKPSFR